MKSGMSVIATNRAAIKGDCREQAERRNDLIFGLLFLRDHFLRQAEKSEHQDAHCHGEQQEKGCGEHHERVNLPGLRDEPRQMRGRYRMPRLDHFSLHAREFLHALHRDDERR